MITTSQRRRAKRAVETFQTAKDRFEATMDFLTKKRCALRGVEWVDVTKGDWDNREWVAKRNRVMDIRYSLYNVLNQEKYVSRKMEEAGFTFLGSGASRTAYLHTDGWVYKVNRRGRSGNMDNFKEVVVARAYHQNKHKSPGKFYIPFMAIAYGVVIAERMKPATDKNKPEDATFWTLGDFDKFIRELGFMSADVHGENYWWDGDRYVLVDCGHFRPYPR